MEKLRRTLEKRTVHPRYQLTERDLKVVPFIDASDDEDEIETIRRTLQEEPVNVYSAIEKL